VSFVLASILVAGRARYRLAPASIDSLVKRAEIILYVRRGTDLHHPAVREVIWTSIGPVRGTISLAPDLPHPGRPDEGSSNAIYGDAIVFLYRYAPKPTMLTGAFVHIDLASGRVDCNEREPVWNVPTSLVVGNAVYFPLPFRRKHGSHVTYPELKTAILSSVARTKK
jgi:hypothetical protein